jgi:hypothetical protein
VRPEHGKRRGQLGDGFGVATVLVVRAAERAARVRLPEHVRPVAEDLHAGTEGVHRRAQVTVGGAQAAQTEPGDRLPAALPERVAAVDAVAQRTPGALEVAAGAVSSTVLASPVSGPAGPTSSIPSARACSTSCAANCRASIYSGTASMISVTACPSRQATQLVASGQLQRGPAHLG